MHLSRVNNISEKPRRIHSSLGDIQTLMAKEHKFHGNELNVISPAVQFLLFQKKKSHTTQIISGKRSLLLCLWYNKTFLHVRTLVKHFAYITSYGFYSNPATDIFIR